MRTKIRGKAWLALAFTLVLVAVWFYAFASMFDRLPVPRNAAEKVDIEPFVFLLSVLKEGVWYCMAGIYLCLGAFVHLNAAPSERMSPRSLLTWPYMLVRRRYGR